MNSVKIFRVVTIALLLFTIVQIEEATGVTVFRTTTRQYGDSGEYYGGTEGGSTLWIYGNGFIQQGCSTAACLQATYVVKLVSNSGIYDCPVSLSQLTNDQLVCSVPKLPANTYDIEIYINGNPIPGSQYQNRYYASFVSTQSRTPIISRILPVSGVPQRMVSLSGDFKTNCYSYDDKTCTNNRNPKISRILIGNDPCTIIDPSNAAPYAPISTGAVQCRFQSNAVGIFNISLVITDSYGNASISPDLYQLSFFGQQYNFRTYSVVSDVWPKLGSIEGGTSITIKGAYFSDTRQNPLVVNVGGEPCLIISSNSTTIQCETSMMPGDNRTYYHGGRGIYLFKEAVFYDLTNLGNSSPPMPSANASRTWVEEASFSLSYIYEPTTLWFIGFIRIPTAATLSFILQASSRAILYLSSDEDPNNKVQIANSSMLESGPLTLNNNTNYYLLCVTSRDYSWNGISFSVKARVLEVNTTLAGGSTIVNEIQRIDIGANITNEHQRITYTTTSIMSGTPEVQQIPIPSSSFQIGFEGIYTETLSGDNANELQTALNNLPTIYPLTVQVDIIGLACTITFPVEMGDVSSVIIISTDTNDPLLATEITKGIASGSKLAFQLDGVRTNYLNVTNNGINELILRQEFNNLFTIKCPPSLNNRAATSSIIYVDDFETNYVYNETSIAYRAFCGRSAQSGTQLVSGNTFEIAYMCFAYKLPVNARTTFILRVIRENDYGMPVTETIPMQLTDDGYWHYLCINLRDTLESYKSEYVGVSSIIVTDIALNHSIPGVLFDTVTLRSSPPSGYESPDDIASYDQSSSGSCIFPFVYDGRNHSACTLDSSNRPICLTSTNHIEFCQSTSIVGARRFIPKYQLLNDNIYIVYSSNNNTIDVSFRYTQCMSPTLIEAVPSRIANVTLISQASKPIGGTYDIFFKGQVYNSIPANIASSDLASLLQSLPNFGFVSVARIRECATISYIIQWLTNGERQPLLSIINTTDLEPANTPVAVVSIQHGGSSYVTSLIDIVRTYHITPQVEVLVNGYSSYCANPNNSCVFQWSSDQTPSITNIQQNGLVITITGTGFSALSGSNKVWVGDKSSCQLNSTNSTVIICTITAIASGNYKIRVYVTGIGFASNNGNFTVTIYPTINSFTPTQARVGGGSEMKILGTGFSPNTTVVVGTNPCLNIQVINSSLIKCKIPPSTAHSSIQVNVTVIDEIGQFTAPTLFMYDVNNVPTISSINPTFITMAGGQLNITGTLFGNSSSSGAVLIGSKKASIKIWSETLVVIDLPPMSPGIYPVTIIRSNDTARSSAFIEYRFYIQDLYPKVGALYGGTDVYVYGEGFDNITKINFRGNTDRIYPCNIVSSQANMIHCQTTPILHQVTITPTGVHPIYGPGYSWSSRYEIVPQGTIVTWRWDSSSFVPLRSYKIQQMANAHDSTPQPGGFDSGPATSFGSFSYQFDEIGIYYYWSPPINPPNLVGIRGVIEVVAAQSIKLTVEANRGDFKAQRCTFPFTYNSVNYTGCTNVNDTRLWCSPTSLYTGQRLYCSTSVPVPAPTCNYSTILNISSCSEESPIMNAGEFLFTTCIVGNVSSISPLQGTAGTVVTILGSGFSANICENQIYIGSSYLCPVINATRTQIMCQIQAGSMLDSTVNQTIRVARNLQGYASYQSQFYFKLQASISSIAPNVGPTSGGTRVVIAGDGFMQNYTRIFIGSNEYTSVANISYNQITFITLSESIYINNNISVSIFVGRDVAICLTSSCYFRWESTTTPYFSSVSPSVIIGPTVLSISGGNLYTGTLNISNFHVYIENNVCNVIAAINGSLTCSVNEVVAGYYKISGYIDGIGLVNSPLFIRSQALLSALSPNTSSIYGGAVLKIYGHGFPNNINDIRVSVGSNVCPVVYTNMSAVYCIIPAQNPGVNQTIVNVSYNATVFLPSLSLTYDLTITPYIANVNFTSSNGSQLISINGYNFIPGQTNVNVGNTTCLIINITNTTITCVIDPRIPAGNHRIIANVDSVGNSNGDFIYTRYLTIDSVSPSEGGYGGGLYITILGDGLSGANASVSICNQTCLLLSNVLNNGLTCITPSLPFNSSDTVCNLTVTVNGISGSASFTYRTDLTASLTSINPIRGGTGGGTQLSIYGTNFPNSTDAISVTIANVSCSVDSVENNTIVCYTGHYSKPNIRAPVIVNINGSGNAVGSILFEYIDLWSSPWTWGGEPPPEEGTIVSIDSDSTIYFDATTPILKVLVIDNATLIFDDYQDVALNVEYIIIVNGGRLQIGTEVNPFQHNAVITIYGHLRSIELPIYGAKVLALREGTVEMHGQPTRSTWAKLGATAVNGSSEVTLVQPVDWPLNSQVVIATTGDRLSQRQNEVRTVTNVSSDGLTLTLDKPLTWTHLGVTVTLDSTTFDIRGEIGLLSHNVIFKGSITETWNDTIEECLTGFDPDDEAIQTCFLGRYGEEIGSDQFGAMIAISQKENSTTNSQQVVVRISNVEIFNVGQAFRLGRQAVNFDANGNMSESYIKSSSIHVSFNRAINIRATHYLTLENNVIYNVMGAAFFLEDGVEVGNTFRGNLVVFVKSSSSLLNEDMTPAAFWINNPYNIFENNAVAGCSHYGYWLQLLDRYSSSLYSIYINYCPNRQPLGRFFNNSVHSTGRYGMWIYPSYAPSMLAPCTSTTNVAQAVIDGLVSWRNNKGIELVMSRTVQIKNALVFDNNDTGIAYTAAIGHSVVNPSNDLRRTFYDIGRGSSLIDSVIIGDSLTSSQTIIPSTAGLIVMWDRGLRVQNVSFINFLSNRTRAIYGPVIENLCTQYCGGWLTKFSQISFNNVTVRGKFRWVYDGLYQDDDGTLGGQSNSIIIRPDGLMGDSSPCTSIPEFENAVQCPLSWGSWVHIDLQGGTYSYYNLGKLNISKEANLSTSVSYLSQQLTGTSGYMMVLRTNQTYTLNFDSTPYWEYDPYIAKIYDLAPGDYLIIQHWISRKPDIINSRTSESFRQSSTPLSPMNNSHLDWYYDTNSSIFSYIVINPTNATDSLDFQIQFYLYNCPLPNCATTTGTTGTTSQPPIPGISPGCNFDQRYQPWIFDGTINGLRVRYWSNDSHWDFGSNSYGIDGPKKPDNNTNVVIPQGVWMMIDCPLPRILSLRIEGTLEFQQGRDHKMYVESIIISGGRLIAGWTNNPFTSKVDIIITGNRAVQITLPNGMYSNGPKVIGVLGGLDLNGQTHNRVWTRLATSALSGQQSIDLVDSVDWAVGDDIIITTTDVNISHTERHQIARIDYSGTRLYTIAPLAYTHKVIYKAFSNGQEIRVAPAVGLLTRNIRVIAETQGLSLLGSRIFIGDTRTSIYDSANSQWISSSCNGHARISNTQFIGYGQFSDAFDSDQRTAIYMQRLIDNPTALPTYVDSCSFDGGFNGAIGMYATNGISITNNVIYNTYRSGIIVTGKNNYIVQNLVAMIYWSGTAQPSVAEFNTIYDAAITSRDAISVTMTNNLVAGAERLAYRIQGDTCTQSSLPPNLYNNYQNNEAHSAMSGVNLWPSDRGFPYDRGCVLIKGFKTYKAWYYGIYINTARNITIDSCSVIDGSVGIFPYVIGPSAVSHTTLPSRVIIQNSIVVGSITPNDCDDTIDPSSLNIIYSKQAIPTVSASSSSANAGGRVGIVFPVFSLGNNMPSKSWTGIGSYPSLDGAMSIKNTTLAFFGNICNRSDIAIQVAQHNDDGQFPITTSSMFVYNISSENLIYNGQPNLPMVKPSACGDMDCDGLKKNLLTDTDGTLLSQPASLFSQSESLWGSQQHGIGDFRIPVMAMVNLTGHRTNINLTYPYRGISRSNSCALQSSWGMYKCDQQTNYRMLIIENMDSDTEKRRVSPVAIMSDNGYIDLINGPPNHASCSSPTCIRRLSTFMAIVQSGRTYKIYFTGSPPRRMRLRLINADASIKCILAVSYNSLQQIDVYANSAYTSPTNRNWNASTLMLLDQPNNVQITSAAGSNYFDRAYQMAYVAIDGATTIELRVSPLMILNFNLPPMDPASFYSGNLVANLAALFSVSPEKIRRVNIISATNASRVQRQASSIRLQVELRDEPRPSSVGTGGILGEILSNMAASVINRYQAGELLTTWKSLNITGDTVPLSLNVQEPNDYSSTDLGIINRTRLVVSPAFCREQSPCTIQPVLVAYDANGVVIQKLGSNDQPWQVKATIVNQPNVVLPGAIANYSGGQTQYSLFGLPNIGDYQIQFAFIQPNGVSSTFLTTANLTVQPSSSIGVTQADLSAQQVNNVYIVNANESFDVAFMPVDRVTGRQLGQIQWGNWTWAANVTLYNLPKFTPPGSLIAGRSSSTVVDLRANTITVTNLAINATGMYILGVSLVSSNNEHVIILKSNGILVKSSLDTITNETETYLSNITFSADFDALNSSGLLEVNRAMIYNYLLSTGMPLASDISLSKGSLVVAFEVGTLVTDTATAVTTLRSNPSAIPGMTLTEVNINGRSFSPFSSSGYTSSDSTATNVGLIVGLTVGLVGSALLVVVIIVINRVHSHINSGRRLIDEPMTDPELAEAPPEPVPEPPIIAATVIETIEPLIEIPELNPPVEETNNVPPPQTPVWDLELIPFD